MTAERVVGFHCLGDQFRALRFDAVIDILTEIAVRPSIEAALLDRCEIIQIVAQLHRIFLGLKGVVRFRSSSRPIEIGSHVLFLTPSRLCLSAASGVERIRKLISIVGCDYDLAIPAGRRQTHQSTFH